MLVLAPPGPCTAEGDGTGLVPCTLEGFLKYSEIAPFCAPVVLPISHISIKNAIMAVAKSANATFHDPPWWACALNTRFTMMSCGASSLAMTYEPVMLAA